jgi:D-sedoheptulose 7-phosphate isomerase
MKKDPRMNQKKSSLVRPKGRAPKQATAAKSEWNSAEIALDVSQLCLEATIAKRAAMEALEVQSGLVSSVKLIANSILAGGTIFACGNGGSACDAMHLCEELVAQYKRKRIGIKAIHFMDASTLTCWGNDYDFALAYERYAETFCGKNDTLVAISTSGNSENVIRAAKMAKSRGAKIVVLTGKGGGKLAQLGDAVISIPLSQTERIQECHITCIHIWCELLETGMVTGRRDTGRIKKKIAIV